MGEHRGPKPGANGKEVSQGQVPSETLAWIGP